MILNLNFSYLKIIHIFHPRYHRKIGGDIPKNKRRYSKKKKKKKKKRKGMSHEIIQLIITKLKIGMKNRSYRYDTNRNRSRTGHKRSRFICVHIQKFLIVMMLVCIKQHQATFQAHFMKKLNNTEADLKKALFTKKRVFWLSHKYNF